MKNPARFPGPGLGTLLKDIFLYMNPVSTSRTQKLHRSHKLHHARLYSASQDGITPDTLRRARRRLKVKAKAREGRARGGAEEDHGAPMPEFAVAFGGGADVGFESGPGRAAAYDPFVWSGRAVQEVFVDPG
jgi:hypothetical protein